MAVKTSNLEMVKVLLPLCKLEHLDNNSNSVFHYASITSKEMINVSAIVWACGPNNGSCRIS